MALYNTKSITYKGDTYVMYPGNLTSETQLTNAAQDATETAGRVYPVRLDANGKLAVNVPWENTTYSFTDSNPTLAWGTQSKVATVGGVDIHVTMPANPNTDHHDWSDITNKPASYPGGCTGNAASATTSNYPLGFTSRSTNATWGNQTGTTITSWGESNGGSIDFRRDNPSSGKMSIKVDGRFYGNEGSLPAMLMNNNNGYWGMGDPDGNYGAVWIRTTENGIIPNQGGNSSNGHCYLGTDSWYFRYGYIQDIYGYLHGNISGSAGSVAWGNVTGKPSTFTPSSHTHNNIVGRGNVACETGSTKPAVSGVSMQNVYNNGYPVTYGNVLTLYGSGAGQLLIGWSGSSSGSTGVRENAYIRSQRDTNGTLWSSWYKLLDSGNYTSYVPQVWSGSVKFTNGVADISSTIGSGKNIYSATLNDGTVGGQRYIFSCSGTKIAAMTFNDSQKTWINMGTATLGMCIVYK